MLSIGVGILGMDFRVSLVVIATLVVTERPLATGSKDLVWELPPNFDTTRCTSSGPFSLVTATTKQGWKFIYTHILTKKYLQHAEAQLHQYFEDHKHELTAFQRLDLLREPRPECERVVLHNAMLTLFPTFSMAALQLAPVGDETLPFLTWPTF
ncbi:unnamed protein product [Effrenium voratum]|nr:unnamed protein product [Effrenium voratum]